MLYRPSPSVVTVRTRSIKTELLASTFTPGSTAPDASLAIPAIPALVCCANVAAGTASIHIVSAAAMRPHRHARAIVAPYEVRYQVQKHRPIAVPERERQAVKLREPTTRLSTLSSGNAADNVRHHSFGGDPTTCRMGRKVRGNELPSLRSQISRWDSPRPSARGVLALLVLVFLAGCRSDSSSRATSATSSGASSGANGGGSEWFVDG